MRLVLRDQLVRRVQLELLDLRVLPAHKGHRASRVQQALRGRRELQALLVPRVLLELAARLAPRVLRVQLDLPVRQALRGLVLRAPPVLRVRPVPLALRALPGLAGPAPRLTRFSRL